MQAYTGVSDEEVIEALEMDRRWQLVLDCIDCEQPPFGKGTLVRFRAALIAKDGDRRLIEQTVEMVKKKGGFSDRSLRAALDSSPLWGAAKVEDTYNLLGHALRKALGLIARASGQELRERQQTASGRLQLRERVAVEHSLAHIGQWQGNRARYLGCRKNLFDLRRLAVVHNLHVIARLPQPACDEAAWA